VPCRKASRNTGRKAGRQAGRKAGRRAGMQADRQTEVQQDRCAKIHTNRKQEVLTNTDIHRQTEIQTDSAKYRTARRQTDRCTDRQMFPHTSYSTKDRHIHRQTDRTDRQGKTDKQIGGQPIYECCVKNQVKIRKIEKDDGTYPCKYQTVNSVPTKKGYFRLMKKKIMILF
jgi:hypothetical protein